jgi:hypothetical protein
MCQEPTLTVFWQVLRLLNASVELAAQFLGIDLRANGDNL